MSDLPAEAGRRTWSLAETRGHDRWRRLCAAFLLVVILGPVAARAQDVPSRVLFRVFLNDGRVLSSYGEWARLDDRVVFSMPTAGGGDATGLHLVSIPADRVDWPRTDQYADSVRAASYAASRGDADFAQLSADVANALNNVALITDPGVRLATAQRARQSLADWPGAHYGYRVAEVRDILGVLDGIIAELRVAVGQTRFDLSLTSSLAAPPTPPLPPPTDAEVVEQLVAAASLVEAPAERISLLQKVIDLIDRAIGTLPDAWAAGIRKSVSLDLAEEQRLDRAYTDLRTSTLAEAAKAATRGDVKALERVTARVTKEDQRLGRRQPGDIEALLATIDVQLDAARQLRLARDQWESRAPAYRRYRRSMGSAFSTFKDATRSLQDVRSMSGPPVNVLGPVAGDLARGAQRLAKVEPPAELAVPHALVRSAWELAESAFRLRLEAVAANDIAGARQASSAAAGALMLYDRARADLKTAMDPPARP